MAQEKSEVIIRVWDRIGSSGAKYGHVSLQTRGVSRNNETFGLNDTGIYVSIYPSGGQLGVLDRQGLPFQTKTLREDERKYQKNKSAITKIKLQLAHDKVARIEELYSKLVDNNFKFSLLGSSLFAYENTHNCSGLIFTLLRESGIFKIATPRLYTPIVSFLINLTSGRILCETLLYVLDMKLLPCLFPQKDIILSSFFNEQILSVLLGSLVSFFYSKQLFNAVGFKNKEVLPHILINHAIIPGACSLALLQLMKWSRKGIGIPLQFPNELFSWETLSHVLNFDQVVLDKIFSRLDEFSYFKEISFPAQYFFATLAIFIGIATLYYSPNFLVSTFISPRKVGDFTKQVKKSLEKEQKIFSIASYLPKMTFFSNNQEQQSNLPQVDESLESTRPQRGSFCNLI